MNELNRFKPYTGTEICQHRTSYFHVVKLLDFKTQCPHTACLLGRVPGLYYPPELYPANAIWPGSNCTRHRSLSLTSHTGIGMGEVCA